MKFILLLIVFVFLALMPIWFQLGGVPIGARSDGRYAAVSRDMADNGHWLIPHDENGPHLTKPPLTYWSEAACIRLFGPTAWAVRLPNAIAGSMVVIGTLLLGSYLYGRRVGFIAAGLVSVMPLTVIIHRLTLTDGLLAAVWLGILAGGYFCIAQPRRAMWVWLLWGSMAVGWLIKGPVAWIPLLCIVCWLVAGGRIVQLRHLRLWRGICLSLLPIFVWVLAVYFQDTSSADVWRHEVGGRLAGGGSHGEPPWYFLGLFLAGLFPATLAMDLPWINRSWSREWARLRRADDVYFWIWAVVLPLVIFSIPSGKLPSYILPLCPPMAILGALTLENWLLGRYDALRPLPGKWLPRRPEMPLAMLIVTVVCYIGSVVAAAIILGFGLVWIALPFAVVPVACGYLFVIDRQRALRPKAIVLVWVSIVVSILWGEAMATHFVRPMGTPALIQMVKRQTAIAEPVFTTFSHYDHSLSYYTGRFVKRSQTPQDLQQHVESFGDALIITASEKRWRSYLKRYPQERGRYREVLRWQDWPEKTYHVLLRPVQKPQISD